MPHFTTRSFCFDQNLDRSSQSYINKKRAQTLYTTTASNQKNDISDNIVVHLSSGTSRCLTSVGGYNVSNYRLLLDLTKGKYYDASNVNMLIPNLEKKAAPVQMTHCLQVTAGKKFLDSHALPPGAQSSIMEGPFLTRKDDSINIELDKDCDCPYATDLLSKFLEPITGAENYETYEFGRLTTQDRLRNFAFPFPFNIPHIP